MKNIYNRKKIFACIFFLLVFIGALPTLRDYIEDKFIYPAQSNDKPTLVIKFINHSKEFKNVFRPSTFSFYISQREILKHVLNHINHSMIIDVLMEKYNLIFDQHSKNYDIIIDDVFVKSIFDRKKIYCDFPEDPRLNQNPKAVKLLYSAEAITPNIDRYDLAMTFNFIEHPKYLRIPLYYMYFGNDVNLEYNRGECNPNKPKFACFLASNGKERVSVRSGVPYDGIVARNSIFRLLSEYKHVESGGKYLNNIGRKLTYDYINDHDKTIQETKEFLGQCKFVIAYENQSWDGYITEKPFQAYFAGAIPLYYADKTVLADINPKAVIFAPDFPDESAVVEYIKKVDSDDELYCKIWNQKLLKSGDLDYEVVKSKLREKLFKIIKDKLNK